MTAAAEERSNHSIFDSLRRLDGRLMQMVQAAESRGEPAADPFRGLYVSAADVARCLSEPDTCERSFGGAQPLAAGPGFTALGEVYGLSQFELDALLIAVAPETDPRYERIFGYLQDDVSRRRPGVNLILDILCNSPADKLAKREIFRPGAGLMRHRLIRLAGDEISSTLRHDVLAYPRISAYLLEEPGLDPRIARFASLLDPRQTATREADPGLVQLVRTASKNRSALVVYFRGGNEQLKREAAIALAGELGAPLLIADMDRAARSVDDFEEWLRDLSREAFFQDAIVYRGGLDNLPDDAARDTALRALAADNGITILSGRDPWQSAGSGVNGVVTVSFETPAWAERRRVWKTATGERGMRIGGRSLDLLAELFRFDESQIRDAVHTAANLAAYRQQPLQTEHLFEAARARSGHELGNLARKVRPVYGWDDIVLNEDALAQLREICRRVTTRHRVLGKWGFARKLSGGKGVNALFYGHSGTGKTMAAEVIASELHLDLYKIDLAGVVSKYIGETEKNLDRIFSAAETANAILLFDEADALFGKRSEVKDSHDRYANLEISYLLQKMEQYEGVAILATNLRQNLDDAFVRRLAFMVSFPFPDEASRLRIWQGIWPKAAPLAADVDLEYLAATFRLSGGNIRNVALAAAFEAADGGSTITMRHLLDATRREFQKLGKSFGTEELSDTFTHRRPLEAHA